MDFLLIWRGFRSLGVTWGSLGGHLGVTWGSCGDFLKPKSGNVKVAPEATPKPVDDNIGNRIEPVKKKPVRRAKNDPRS